MDAPIGEWVQWNPTRRTSVHNGQFRFPQQKDRQPRFTDTGYLCIVYLFCVNRANRPFHRYGGHIELIRFKEYYRMPRGHEHISLAFSSASRNIFS